VSSADRPIFASSRRLILRRSAISRSADDKEFYAMAAGAILFVVGQIWPVARRLPADWVMTGIVLGFLVALGSDLVISYAGG
jgi:hypothetical protein